MIANNRSAKGFVHERHEKYENNHNMICAGCSQAPAWEFGAGNPGFQSREARASSSGFPSGRGCESILKAYKNLYLKIFNLLIFIICREYKPRFVLQILNAFTISGAWESSVINHNRILFFVSFVIFVDLIVTR